MCLTCSNIVSDIENIFELSYSEFTMSAILKHSPYMYSFKINVASMNLFEMGSPINGRGVLWTICRDSINQIIPLRNMLDDSLSHTRGGRFTFCAPLFTDVYRTKVTFSSIATCRDTPMSEIYITVFSKITIDMSACRKLKACVLNRVNNIRGWRTLGWKSVYCWQFFFWKKFEWNILKWDKNIIVENLN